MGNIMDDWFGFDPPSPPKVPDPQETAATQQQFAAQQAALQAQYNLDALRTNISANRLDQDTPFGSIRYIQTGIDPYGNPTYGAQTQFTDDQQAILDQLEQNQLQTGDTIESLLSNTSGMYGNPIDLPQFNSSYGLPDLPDSLRNMQVPGMPDFLLNTRAPGVPDSLRSMQVPGMPDFSTGADSVVSQAMDRQLAYLQPYHTKALENLHTELANRGLHPGNPAYDAEMRRIRQSQSESVGQFLNTFQNQAYTQQLQTYAQNLARQQQEFGQGSQVFTQDLASQQQSFAQQLQTYVQDLARQQQEFGQGSQTFVHDLARQQQGFTQDLQGHQERTKEALQEYGVPLDTIKALMSLGNPASSMNFANIPGANLASPNVGNVDFAGIQNQVQQALNQVYQMQLGQYNSGVNAVGSGISTILGAPSGTLFGGLTGAAGGGLASLLGLNSGNNSMRLF